MAVAPAGALGYAMNALDRPTVLVVGGGERMTEALLEALERHQLHVESAPTESVVEAAFAAAPDLLVLHGDAARNGGEAALSRLAGHPTASMVPVALLSDEGIDRRLSAFRHGVVAVVPRTASADGMARRIAELAHELPHRSGELDGELGEATLEELVALFSEQLRSGILSVTAGDGEGASAQVVLRAGRPVTEAIQDLVNRLRPLLSQQSGPLRYEFHESPEARLRLLDEDDAVEDGGTDALMGKRILLIEQNPARADVLVQELRAAGSLVVVADGDGRGLERAHRHDPDLVVLDGSGVDGWALPALRRLRRHPRLRWASLLVVDAHELWPGDGAHPDLRRLGSAVRPLVRSEQDLQERTRSSEGFDTRLELIGPSRMLRALAATELGLKVSIAHPRARVDVDLAEGLVVGARVRAPGSDEDLAEGPAALAALLGLSSGRVRVERREAPSMANVMAPLDDALAAAEREEPPVRPSLPPPSGMTHPPSAADSPGHRTTPASSAEAPSQLMGRLEQLLERLQDALPDEVATPEAQPPRTKADAILPPRPKVAVPRPPGAPVEGASPLRSGPLGVKDRPRGSPPDAGSQTATVPAPASEREGGSGLPANPTVPVPPPAPIESRAMNSARGSHTASRTNAGRVGAGSSGTQPQRTPRRRATTIVGTGRAPEVRTDEGAGPPRFPQGAPPSTHRAEPRPAAAFEMETRKVAEARVGSSPSEFRPEDDDLPVIEATAEPSAPASGESGTARGNFGSPEVHPNGAPDPSRNGVGSIGTHDLGSNGLAPGAPESSTAGPSAGEPPGTPLGPASHLDERPRHPALFGGVRLPPLPFILAGAATVGLALFLFVGVLSWWLLSTPASSDPPAYGSRAPDEEAGGRGEEAAPTHTASTPREPAAASTEGPARTADAHATGSSDTEPSHAGPSHAGPPDVGPSDAGPTDVGPPNTGTRAAVAEERDDPRREAEEREERVQRLIRSANFARNQGNLGPAERDYVQALNLDHNNPRALAGLTRLALSRRDTTQALRWARRLTQAHGRNPNNHVLLGDVYQQMGNHRAAVQAWRRAVELSPGHQAARQRLQR